MPRVRSQLAIEVPPELLQRLRKAACKQGRTVTALVVEAIEAAMAGTRPTPQQQEPDQLALSLLASRVAALEAVLQQPRRPAPLPPPVTVPEPWEPLPEPELPAGVAPLPERRLTHAEAAGLLTTPEVGAALGLASYSALTNWIARESKKNGSAVGRVYRGHRLRGMGLLPGGQKPGWLWEPVLLTLPRQA